MNKRHGEHANDPRLLATQAHRQWLQFQANALLDFFRPNLLIPAGGFSTLDDDGCPLPAKSGRAGTERELHETTRIVHCYSLAKLSGRTDCELVIDHGMDFLWSAHRDTQNGGFYWSCDDKQPVKSDKLAYGHAFVLLAASSAKSAGHRDADRLLTDITSVLLDRFWDENAGATREEYTADWQDISDYRGQNSNMHLTEALMAAFQATNDRTYLSMAQSISQLIVDRHARNAGWRIAEHFSSDWEVDNDYCGDPVFRPKGFTPGHALEWSRLLVELWLLDGRQHSWMPDAAKQLFVNAVQSGWDHQSGGFYYTLDSENNPDQAVRLWWPCAEGIAAAAVLATIDDDPVFETWYRNIWAFVDQYFIDHERGGWFPELDTALERKNTIFVGKPDLYHAFQACLIPISLIAGKETNPLTGTIPG